jgi:hypothetical protein
MAPPDAWAPVTDAAPFPPDDASPTGPLCPPGLTCDVACDGGGTTTISGVVYDPAGKRPLYNAQVYVPAQPLEPLARGVLTGADACLCTAFYKTPMVTSTSTGIDGTFRLDNVPAGQDVPLVLQAGKWRRSLRVNVGACQDNPQPDRSLTLPGTVSASSEDNMPDIAVSTGSAEMLECLLTGIGISPGEYVAGSATTGHVHIFAGGLAGDAGTDSGAGTAESPPFPGAPPSDTALWADWRQLMPYDLTMLSCEGGETYDANPVALEQYLNAGGRVLASHFHYAWFAGPLVSHQSYVAPPDWGSNLAAWTGGGGEGAHGEVGGVVDTTLNGTANAMPFPRGIALQEWLTLHGDLADGGAEAGVPAGEVPIEQPRFNAFVGPTNTPSQPRITADSVSGDAGAAMVMTFDTPVMLAPPTSYPVLYCGRAIYTGFHAGGDTPSSHSPAPGGCPSGELSPQEEALEFLLFDYAGCIVVGGPGPPPPGDL